MAECTAYMTARQKFCEWLCCSLVTSSLDGNFLELVSPEVMIVEGDDSLRCRADLGTSEKGGQIERKRAYKSAGSGFIILLLYQVLSITL